MAAHQNSAASVCHLLFHFLHLMTQPPIPRTSSSPRHQQLHFWQPVVLLACSGSVDTLAASPLDHHSLGLFARCSPILPQECYEVHCSQHAEWKRPRPSSSLLAPSASILDKVLYSTLAQLNSEHPGDEAQDPDSSELSHLTSPWSREHCHIHLPNCLRRSWIFANSSYSCS